MPSQIMDQRSLSPSSYFFDEPCYPSQRFWNPDVMLDHQGKKSNPSPTLEKLIPGRDNDMELLEFSEPGLVRGQVAKLSIESRVVGAEKARNLSITPWTSADHSLGIGSNIFMHPASYATESNKVHVEGQHENGLFSSTLSEIFSRKVRLSTNNVVFRKFAGVVTSHHDEEEPLESLEDIEAQTIGNLLPDEDDLLSGANYNQEYTAQPNNRDDIEDFDLFSSGGGMELGEGDGLSSSQSVRNSDISGTYSNGLPKGVSSSIVAEHPYIENPSRTLFVRNMSSNVEDSELKALFEEYGDIRILYTACKHRGYVMISYYDIRAACAAIRSLQNKPLRRRNLDIHFSTPKDNPSEKDINQGILVVNLDFSISNDNLFDTFGGYGEIKEIRESPYKRHQKFIEFYDVRAAEAALCALNRSDMEGKGVKLELNRPESMRPCSATLSSPELEIGKSIYHQMGNSPDSISECFGPHGAVTSNCVESEAVQGLHSSFGSSVPISQFMENGLYQSLPPTVPYRSPSSLRIPTAIQSGHGEPNITLSNMELGFRSRPPFHPHSLSDYHGGLACGVPYNSPGTMEENISSRPKEVITNGPNLRAGLNGHPVEPNESVYGSSNGSCPLHGKQSVWSNSNSYHSHPSDPLLWSNSPSFVNGHHSPQLHGLRRALPHMINAGLPIQHHVGSAPTVNGSFWDPRYGYEGESYEVSEFHPGSLGSTGFSDYSAMHHMDPNGNIFPRMGGNYMDLELANVEMQSPQQRYHMLPRRHSMIHMSNSFESNSERIISRRSEANSSSQADNKRQYDLDIDLILRGDDTRTTLMIKNIPNKYTSKMLLAAIDENHRGTYDFIYLPIDFKNKCNVGYAFINMINPSQIVPFYQTFHGKKWEKFNSEKVASLAYARIQGKAALISHFQNSSLMNEDKRCRPILFHSDGPNAGDQEPFPMGVNIRSRPGRGRTNSSEENGEKATDSSSSGSVRNLE
ncbi:hypothetical protein ACHQM5_007761 [Ranunculus cassubicifolius]